MKNVMQSYKKIDISNFASFVFCFFLCLEFNVSGMSCDPGNLLLQPGGYYAAPEIESYKKCKQNTYCDCLPKHVQLQGLFYCCSAEKAFNADRSQVPLSINIFKKEFAFKDIFLTSKLADEGKLTLPGQPSFGGTKDEQYIALLAPTKVNVMAAQKELGFNLSGLYFFDIPKAQCLLGAIGLYVPIRYHRHYIDFKFLNGTLFSQRTLGQGGSLSVENTLTQFFSSFSSVEDFFVRAIVEPKGLKFKPLQSRVGIGDISALGFIDFTEYFRCTDAAQFGLNIIFPTGNEQNGNIIWPIELGHGGSFQLEPFFNGYFETCLSFFNPIIFASARFSLPHNVMRRVPKLKNKKSELLLPSQFQQHDIEPFSEFDSSVIDFADQTACLRAHEGTLLSLRLGNFFYDIFCTPFKLGIYYDFYAQEKDVFCAKNNDGFFDIDLLEKDTHKISHSVLWNIAYKCNDEVELYAGFQHVFAGKNVVQHHKLFTSMSLYF